MSSQSSVSIDYDPTTASRSVSGTTMATPNIGHGEFVQYLVEWIKCYRNEWSFGDKLGVAYHFTSDRLFKQNNVVNRSGNRVRIEMRNVNAFFNKLRTTLLEYPFVIVQLFGSAEANLMYCHSKLIKLETKRAILLIGDVCLVQGHFNNYFAEPTPIEPGTVIKLYGRIFDIRISSNYHSIFTRTEDIIKNRIKLASMEERRLSNDDDDFEIDEETGSECIDEMDSLGDDEHHSRHSSIIDYERNQNGHSPASIPGRIQTREMGTQAETDPNLIETTNPIAPRSI